MNYEELKLFLNKNTITDEIKIFLTTLIKESCKCMIFKLIVSVKN